MKDKINRGTGLLVIEVIDSNPNGDPDRENDPRQRNDGRGEITSVSFKRKLRDLVLWKEGPVWKSVCDDLGIDESEYSKYDIMERKDIVRQNVINEIENKTFLDKYWDARVFGNTFLESEKEYNVQTGVVQFALAVSISPIRIERLTNTKQAPTQEGKSKGMAPLGYRIVQHGVYCMPFFVNATAALKTQCSKKDVDIILKLIPYAYPHTASYLRSQVNVRHAFFVEHNSPVGRFNDFEIIEMLTPKRLCDIEIPSTSKDGYDFEGLREQVKKLDARLSGKTHPIRDLIQEI